MQAEQKLPQIETARARKAVVEREMAEARIERDDLDYLAKAFVRYLGITAESACDPNFAVRGR
jgi:hypothetical protein